MEKRNPTHLWLGAGEGRRIRHTGQVILQPRPQLPNLAPTVPRVGTKTQGHKAPLHRPQHRRHESLQVVIGEVEVLEACQGYKGARVNVREPVRGEDESLDAASMLEGVLVKLRQHVGRDV